MAQEGAELRMMMMMGNLVWWSISLVLWCSKDDEEGKSGLVEQYLSPSDPLDRSTGKIALGTLLSFSLTNLIYKD